MPITSRSSSISFTVFSALLVAACGGPTAVGYEEGTTPAQRERLHRATPAPTVAPLDQLTATTVVADFAVPREFAVEWFVAMPLERTLTGTDDVPGVRRSVMLTEGDWGQPGARRRVEVKDDSTALEQILEARLPDAFRYVVWNYTSDAARYVRYGVGEFNFESAGDGTTRVSWTYAFEANGWPASWFLGGFVRGDWREFMTDSLANMKADAERSFRRQGRDVTRAASRRAAK